MQPWPPGCRLSDLDLVLVWSFPVLRRLSGPSGTTSHMAAGLIAPFGREESWNHGSVVNSRRATFPTVILKVTVGDGGRKATSGHVQRRKRKKKKAFPD